MRLSIFILLSVVAVACKTSVDKVSVDPSNIFFNVAGRAEVVITLSEYHLDSLPEDIGALKDIERLLVYRDRVVDWSTVSPMDARMYAALPPFKSLPASITNLENLRALSLVEMDLADLPEDFARLQKLDTLCLSMNKLHIGNELEKLKKLKNLKFLELTGNAVDTSDINELKKAIPNLKITSNYDYDFKQ